MSVCGLIGEIAAAVQSVANGIQQALKELEYRQAYQDAKWDSNAINLKMSLAMLGGMVALALLGNYGLAIAFALGIPCYDEPIKLAEKLSDKLLSADERKNLLKELFSQPREKIDEWIEKLKKELSEINKEYLEKEYWKEKIEAIKEGRKIEQMVELLGQLREYEKYLEAYNWDKETALRELYKDWKEGQTEWGNIRITDEHIQMYEGMGIDTYKLFLDTYGPVIEKYEEQFEYMKEYYEDIGKNIDDTIYEWQTIKEEYINIETDKMEVAPGQIADLEHLEKIQDIIDKPEHKLTEQEKQELQKEYQFSYEGPTQEYLQHIKELYDEERETADRITNTEREKRKKGIFDFRKLTEKLNDLQLLSNFKNFEPQTFDMVKIFLEQKRKLGKIIDPRFAPGWNLTRRDKMYKKLKEMNLL